MATESPRTQPETASPAADRPQRRGRLPGLGAFSVARQYRDFRYVWLGNFFAIAAQWLQMLSIGWLVLELTDGNALLTGTAVGIRTIPVLVIGPWAGVLGDRGDRRKLVMITQSAMAVAAILFAILVISSDWSGDTITGPLRWWHPFIYMTIAGIAHSIIQPVRQAMVANTVPRNALAGALALNGMVYPSTRVLSPAIGGLLIAFLGFKWNFFLEALLYVLIVLLLLPVKLPYRTDAPRSRESAFASMLAGLRYVKNEKRILQLILLPLIPNLVFQPLVFVLPIFTTEVLHRGPDAGGALAAAVGVGGFIAAVFIALAGYIFPKGIAAFLGLIGGCVFVILFSQSYWMAVSFGMLMGMGFCQYVFRVANSTLIQTVVPDTLRGRVMSIYMLDHGLTPLSTLLISLFIHLWQPSHAFTVIGFIALGVALLQTLTFRSARALP